MDKTTQNRFPKRLSQYGAMTLAIAGVADASGQIAYTDINPDFNGSSDYMLDLDGNGIIDFTIFDGAPTSTGGAVFGAVQLGVSNGSVLGSAPSYVYPFALNEGAIISNNQTDWQNSSSQTLNFASCYGGAGDSNWCGVTDKYLGLRFLISGNLHYGWAKLDVDATGKNWSLKEYAYNTVSGAAITAGQTLGINESSTNKVRVVALNKSIALYNLPENTSYNLLSTAGQSVLKGHIKGNTHVIEANTIATGIYVLELNDVVTNSIIRKKIVL